MCTNLFSKACGTDNIEANEIAEAVNINTNANIDDMNSLDAELQEVSDASDDSRSSSRSSSRPGSSLSQNQEVFLYESIENFIILFEFLLNFTDGV